jgi:hypothetical protein
MSPVFSIYIPPLMFLLHLWLIICLYYFFLCFFRSSAYFSLDFIIMDAVFDEFHFFYPHSSSDVSPASLVDHLSLLLFPDVPSAPLSISRLVLPSFVTSSESSPMFLDYTVKFPMTQFYSHHEAHLSDAPPSFDELFSDVSSSSFGEDMPFSPSVEPSSPVYFSLEQLIRCSHCLRLTITLPFSQSLLFLS